MSGRLLPIGSVVLLKNSDKALMVCGYCPTGPANPGYVYDYSGFGYPEGYTDTLKIYQFDNEQVDKVFALGYQDAELFVYMGKLQGAIDDIKAQTKAKFEQPESAEE